MDDSIIKVENVGKTFKLPYEKRSTVKSMFLGIFRSKKGYELQHALKGISFEVKKGEFFGIVGRNGSGKSTLLKLLADIYTPTKGSIEVKGKLTPFIELGVGFNPELTGRENVFLNGALLGFNRKEMQTMYNEIVEFAELGKFMDQKLKNYSSGMQVRLAFSIAIRAKSDILLIDEVLAVGDTAFQQKCFDYFEKIKDKGTTVIFVSHDMDTVRRFCDRALLIKKGELQFIGKSTEAANLYLAENEEQVINKLKKDNDSWEHKTALSIDLNNKAGKKADVFNHGDTLLVKMSWPKDLEPKPKNAGLALFHEGRIIFGSNTGKTGLKPEALEAVQEIVLNLGPGKYTTVAALFSGDNLSDAYIYESKGPEFFVKRSNDPISHWEGITKLPYKWL